ncbi:hypothetical protein [Bacillus toyonensis]|uniref:hypothetical protein n=1 Tax=Bacillus toyonensis TaxID=155322 RepID=UPI000BF31D3B|nr:hypothetical protein [Bacillus toyonensis]PFY86025.1 hypothetical protein COL62_02185 [Bacillus toyonensis]
MRHTRMRQIAKAHGEEERSREWRDEVGTDPIDFIRYCKSLGLTPQLDPTFKWHRGGTYMSWVEFKPNPKETRLIPAK